MHHTEVGVTTLNRPTSVANLEPAVVSARAMRCLPLLLALLACGSPRDRPRGTPRTDAGGAQDSGGAQDTGAVADGGSDPSPQGLALMERLAGLWSGPATQTPLGNFAMMNVDFRAASDQFLFGRVDLDEDNALRFGFSLETHGEDVLTYRNGGYFLGLQRDDRTELVEHDETALTWRFCHVDRGCEYIDAVYDFEGDDRLIFDVVVMGAQHVYWDARKLEMRELPPGFVAGLVTQPVGPFPAMPNLRATVSWSQPLAAAAPVWVVLTVSGCSTSGCTISRHIRTVAPAGATSAEIFLEQVHAGDYKILAVVDRNSNLEALLRPDSGDGVSLPDTGLTIAPSGDTAANVQIVFDLP
jgi:hypothetical protein